ncbi:MAG: hypothetical protein ACLRTA_00360 [Clostridia bacterium]
MKKSRLSKVLTISLAALMVFGLASCGGGGSSSGEDITVISVKKVRHKRCIYRTDGALQDDVDRTVDTAEISNSTSVLLSQ